jgi:hypothetical protein
MILRFDGYGSHILVLGEICNNRPIKKVLEFGPGDYSTHFFVETQKANLISIESGSIDWYHKAKEINPNTLWMPDTQEVLAWAERLEEQFDLIFVDTLNDIRWQLVNRLQKNTHFVVVHDTEQSQSCFHFCDLQKGFCYADFLLHRPWTGVFTDDKEMMDILIKKHPGCFYPDQEHLRDKLHLN